MQVIQSLSVGVKDEIVRDFLSMFDKSHWSLNSFPLKLFYSNLAYIFNSLPYDEIWASLKFEVFAGNILML